MNKILEFQIIDFDFLQVSVLNLSLSILALLAGFVFSIALKKILLRKYLDKYVILEIRNKFVYFLRIILYLIVISIIIEINTEKFYDFQFVSNKYFEINTLKILSSFFIVSLNFLIIYSFKIARNKLSNYSKGLKKIADNTFKLILLILWLITISTVLKSILTSYSNFIEFSFFNISNTKVTIGNVIFGGIVIIIGQFILLATKGFFKRQVNHKKIDIGTSYSIFRILKYVIWIILIAVILETSGFELSILLAGSAALLIGLGFGVQQLFSDFISGLVLIAEGTVKVGDIIEFDGSAGKVIASNLRTTEMLTIDNERIIVPNTKLTAGNIVNKTKNDKKTRFHIAVGVAYGSDIELVEKLLTESAKTCKEVLTKPEPSVLFSNFGNSSLDFKLLFWSHNEFRVEVLKSTIRKSIDKKFRENNISIPFPQTDVHLFKT